MNQTPPPKRRRRSLRRIGSTLALVAALLALFQAGSPASGQTLGVIRDVSVAEDDTGAVLTMGTSRKLEWTANWLSTNELQLTFAATVARDDVTDLAPDAGLIAAVTLRAGVADNRPATLVTVSLRQPASYASTLWKNRSEFTFVARTEAAAGEAAAAAETAEEPLAPAPFEPTAAARAEISGEYHIGPGDLLEVSVFGLDDFDRAVRVLRDGSISLPLLGGIRLADMTLQEAESKVARLLSERQLVNDPQVTFFVKEYVSRGVSVQGAVESPGVYQMIQQRSLLEILGEAGGLSGRESDRAGQLIFVIRKTADGEQQRIEIDAEQLVNQGRADLNIQLYPGDVVLVPFAQKYRVYVSGAVARPGPVEYLSSDGITVLQAITAAGGPTERGNLGNVAILRQLADGSEKRTKVNVKAIRKGKQQDVQLERNDTVIVGEWFF